MGGRTPRGPDFLAHVLPSSAPHLDLGSSVQCSNVGLCLYSDMQDIHQCGYGSKPVQAPSPLLPKEQSGDLFLDLGTPLESSLFGAHF